MESCLVVIHVLTDEVVYQFRLVAHYGILDHRIENVLTLLVIVLFIRIQVGNQFQDICYVDDVTMKQFQTEVYILQTSFVIIGNFSLCSHSRSIDRRIDNADSDVQVLALEIGKLLFGHVEVWIIGIVVLVYLYLSLFFDDFTECQYEVTLIQFALQCVDILWLGVFL